MPKGREDSRGKMSLMHNAFVLGSKKKNVLQLDSGDICTAL